MKYNPTITIPSEISQAAYSINIWAAMNGLKDWSIGGVSCRSYTERMESELSSLRSQLEEEKKKRETAESCVEKMFTSQMEFHSKLNAIQDHTNNSLDEIISKLPFFQGIVEKNKQLQDALSCCEEALKTCDAYEYDVTYDDNKVQEALSKIQSLRGEGK